MKHKSPCQCEKKLFEAVGVSNRKKEKEKKYPTKQLIVAKKSWSAFHLVQIVPRNVGPGICSKR